MIEEIQTRLEEAPEKIDMTELRKLLSDTLDRTGHGPSSTQNHNHNIRLGDRLDAARERAKTARLQSAVIDAEAVDVTETSNGDTDRE